MFVPVLEEIRSRHNPAFATGSNVVRTAISIGEAAAGPLQITKNRGHASDDQADWLLKGVAKRTVFNSRLLSTLTKQGIHLFIYFMSDDDVASMHPKAVAGHFQQFFCFCFLSFSAK